MRNRILRALVLAGALLFVGTAARAQTQTNVTATVKDSSGIPYAGGTYSIQLVPSTGTPTVSGNLIGGAFNGRLDSTGTLNVVLWANASIVPSGTKWQFTVCVSPSVAPPLGTGGQCTPPTLITISGATQDVSATLNAVAPVLTTINVVGSPGGVISAQGMNLNGSGTGAISQYSFPTVEHITIAGLPATDISPLCMTDSNLIGQLICAVMKSNGQSEWLFGNANCVGDLQVNNLGNEVTFGPVSESGACDTDLTTLNGNIHLSPGTSGNYVIVDSSLASGPVQAKGTGAALTGTGACVTFSATVSNGFAADAICSGSTGAATIVVTPPASAPAASTSLNCWGDDTTSGHLLKGIQSGAGTSTCTVSFTSVTTSDFITIHWEIL